MKWFVFALVGIAVIILGFIISAYVAATFNGWSFESGSIYFATLYLSGVVAACTCIIASKLNK